MEVVTVAAISAVGGSGRAGEAGSSAADALGDVAHSQDDLIRSAVTHTGCTQEGIGPYAGQAG